MADETTMKSLRKLETELDQHHTTLPFHSVDPGLAAYALLAMFDSMMVMEPWFAAGGPEDARTIQIKSSMEEGLSQTLRWKIIRGFSTNSIPKIDDELMGLVPEYFIHGCHYDSIATFHVMLSKGWVDVEADVDRKIVRFLPSPHPDVRKMMAGYDEGFSNGIPARLAKIRNSEFMAKVGEEIRRLLSIKHELRDGRIVLLAVEELNHPMTMEIEACFPAEFDDIALESDLGGFTASDFQVFWSALSRWSKCLGYLFLEYARKGFGPTECIPTQCVPKDEFIRTMQLLSGLGAAKSIAITNRLSWGVPKVTPDIFLQPLIVGPDVVCWSCRIVDYSRSARNMLRLMTKMGGETKKIADDLIGNRELPAARRLGEFMAQKKRKGWISKLGKFDIKAGGMIGQIDLLAWNQSRPEEVLLIEYKASLGTAEIHEIGAATDLMIKGQEQLRKCTRILELLSVGEKLNLYPFVPWERVKAIYGIVVSSGGNPSTNYDHSVFPAVSLSAFRERVPAADFCRPSRLWDACRKRDWLSHFDDAEPSHNEIRVGELTYFIPAIAHASDLEEDAQDSLVL